MGLWTWGEGKWVGVGESVGASGWEGRGVWSEQKWLGRWVGENGWVRLGRKVDGFLIESDREWVGKTICVSELVGW